MKVNKICQWLDSNNRTSGGGIATTLSIEPQSLPVEIVFCLPFNCDLNRLNDNWDDVRRWRKHFLLLLLRLFDCLRLTFETQTSTKAWTKVGSENCPIVWQRRRKRERESKRKYRMRERKSGTWVGESCSLSVTRFGKISPLWKNNRSNWQFLRFYLFLVKIIAYFGKIYMPLDKIGLL